MLGSLSFVRRLYDTLRTFSPFERLLLYVFSALLALSAGWMLVALSNTFSVQVPARGGSFTEGAVGTARFVNPLLATSQADHDLTALVYSGLMRQNGGEFTPDLAESYTVSDDGTEYTFRLREATFQDGAPVTAEDVAFTIALAQDPAIKSARRANWEGVQVSVEDAHTVHFKLPNAYAPFIGNTTLGILPKHLWENIPTDEFSFDALNTAPIGSGPFKVRDVSFDSAGAPTEYVLESFRHFALGTPHLRRIIYRLYSNEGALYDAYRAHEIDSFLSLSPKTLPTDVADAAHLVELPLTRVFAVFFNQNHAPVLANTVARQALSVGVDREMLIDTVLGGFGEPLSGPIPPDVFTPATTTPSDESNPAAILSAGGWRLETASSTEAQNTWIAGESRLSFALATADTPELVETAQLVVDGWRSLGIDVKLETYSLSDFNQTILRPRAYDAILFGKVLTRPLDPFAFWHSSQRNDPGLNLALYANADADRLLTEARSETDTTERRALYDEFVATVAEDAPAVFLYAPSAVYAAPAHITNITRTSVTLPAERFLSVHTWYRDTEQVWQFFTK